MYCILTLLSEAGLILVILHSELLLKSVPYILTQEICGKKISTIFHYVSLFILFMACYF